MGICLVHLIFVQLLTRREFDCILLCRLFPLWIPFAGIFHQCARASITIIFNQEPPVFVPVML